MFMTRPMHLFLLALATTFFAGAAVHADVINWDYSLSMRPHGGAVLADGPSNSGRVTFDLGTEGSVTNSSYIVAANLRAVSEASAQNPDQFTQGGYYRLAIHLTDALSGLSGVLTFTGKLSGTISANSTNLTNDFFGLRTKVIDLGNTHFEVTIGPFVPPGPPSSGNQGSIGAYVDVSSIHSADAPEPSTLILSCLGGIGIVGTSLRRLRHRLATA